MPSISRKKTAGLNAAANVWYDRFPAFAMRIMALTLLIASAATTFGEPVPERVRIASYNLKNYFVEGESIKGPFKDSESKNANLAMLKLANPDILLLLEIGGPAAMEDLRSALAAQGLEYTFSSAMRGDDESRYIGLLSKTRPVTVEKRNDLRYSARPKNKQDEIETVPLQRGFIHALFLFGEYKLHIIGAHLKSQLPHYKYNSTDMRRSEARLLRKVVEGILEADPAANVLVLGDLNDDYSSSPIEAFRKGEAASSKPLYDLRPLDVEGCSWTHWWNAQDSYGRIDYAVATEGLLPEIDFNKTSIVAQNRYWMLASDHRPVLVVLSPKDAQPWTPEKLRGVFIDGVRGNPNPPPAPPTTKKIE